MSWWLRGESQNLVLGIRMIQSGMEMISFNPLLQKRSCGTLGQIPQGIVLLNSKYLKRWTLHHPSGQPVPVLSYPLGVSPFPYVQLVAWQLALVFFTRTSGRGLHWWEVNKTSSKTKRKMVALPQFVSQGDISVFYPRRISHQAEISHELPIAVPTNHHVGVLHPKFKCLNSFIFSFQLSSLCID